MLIASPDAPDNRNLLETALPILLEQLEGVELTFIPTAPEDGDLQQLQQANAYIDVAEAPHLAITYASMALGVPVVLAEGEINRELADTAAVYLPVHKGGDMASALAVALYGVLLNDQLALQLSQTARLRIRELELKRQS